VTNAFSGLLFGNVSLFNVYKRFFLKFLSRFNAMKFFVFLNISTAMAIRVECHNNVSNGWTRRRRFAS